MSAHWQAGDRAICVADKPWQNPMVGVSGGPVKDTVYLVSAVWVRRADIGLMFADWPGAWYDSVEFRRVVPRCDQADVGQEVGVPVVQPIETQPLGEPRP